MIDYTKIIVKNSTPLYLEDNPLLDFYDEINLTTGEIKTKNIFGATIIPSKKAYYNGLKFILYETGTFVLSGSLHKYYNEGVHNYNDFDINAILWVQQDLKNKFNLDFRNCILKCLEIGINITPPIPTNQILNNCILHETQPFEFVRNSNKGKYKQVEHAQYIVKIYNKALQYRSKAFEIDCEILRFEIKFTRMVKLHAKGIYSLQDLINFGLENFKNDLIKEWQNVLYFDNTTRIDTLNTKLKNAFGNYSNSNYWTDLLSNNQYENFKYHRRQLRAINNINSDKVQSLITEIMSKKIETLNIKTT